MDVSPTQILPFNQESIREAARLIQSGQPVAVPTETVYGLAADAMNPRAVTAIYEAKGRPSFNPLIIHVPHIMAAEMIGQFDHESRELARRHWPGPLTIVVPLKKSSGIASLATAGLSTVALRVPAHPAMQQLLMAVGRPLAAPSANASGSISPTRAEHVERSLGGKIPLIIDGGPTDCGLESTIVASTGGFLRILRKGPVEIPGAIDSAANGKVESPGQLAAHYAPSKPIRIDAFEFEPDEYVIGFGSMGCDFDLSRAGDTREAAARLFDALHRADWSDKPRIAVAPIPDIGLGAAINDRLRRAAVAEADED